MQPECNCRVGVRVRGLTWLDLLLVLACEVGEMNSQWRERRRFPASCFCHFSWNYIFVNVKCNYTGIRQHKNSPKPFLKFQIIEFFFHFFPFHAWPFTTTHTFKQLLSFAFTLTLTYWCVWTWTVFLTFVDLNKFLIKGSETCMGRVSIVFQATYSMCFVPLALPYRTCGKFTCGLK